ncbi:MAG TPA: hypothetical protein VGK67_04975 [Myxococcales bacterium]|jgi:hypothetical protein
MIWQCADCGHQVVHPKRPAACRFCGPDVEFFGSEVKQTQPTPQSTGHAGTWSVGSSKPAPR